MSDQTASPERLARLLDVPFDDLGLLDRALTHRSWAFEHGGVQPNERLEFLGDAVLALVVTDEVFHAHPDEQEGRLAKVRSAAVKTASLAEVARELGLGPFIKLGRGEAASGGADKDSILADTLEAFRAVTGGVRIAFEPRHDSWHDDAVYELLERHDAALCWWDRLGTRGPLVKTASWIYLRLHEGRARPLLRCDDRHPRRSGPGGCG